MPFFSPASIKLEFFNSLTDEKIKTIAESLKDIKYPKEKINKEEIQALTKETLKPEHNEELFGFLFAIHQFYRFSDGYEEFIEISNNVISDSKNEKTAIDRAINFVDNSLLFIKDYFEEKRLESFTKRGGNSYSSISYACDLRGRYSEEYEYEEISIENYQPKLHDLIPIINISFSFEDDEQSKSISFQATAEQLNKIIGILLAAQKELRLLDDLYNKKVE